MTKNLLSIILGIALVCAVGSCSSSQNKSGLRSQGLIEEANLLMKLRQFDDAKAKIEIALEDLDSALKKDPNNIDLRLLRSRALFALFISQNTIVMESAEVRPRSLVRMPKPFDFVNYATTAALAEKELIDLLNNEESLTFEQKGFIHGSLAAIYRLNLKTISRADEEYTKSISAYKSWLSEIQRDSKKVNKFNVEVIETEDRIRELKLAQVEVNLLDEEWKKALTLLESHLAGDDLEYFAVQIELLEDEIAELRNKIIEDKVKNQASRGTKLTEALDQQRVYRLNPVDEFVGTDALTFDLNHRKQKLNAVKNNLMYRIICYYHLGNDYQLRNSQHILATYYPELHQDLNKMLNE